MTGMRNIVLVLAGSAVAGLYGAESMGATIPAPLLQSAGLNAVFVAKFCLFFAAIFAWLLACSTLLERLFHIPVIAGQIIAGILLGPSGIDIANISFFAYPYTVVDSLTSQAYTVLSSDLFVFFIFLISSALTVSYLLWIAGHETDIKDIVKVGPVAVCAGVLGALLPIIIIAGVFYLLVPGYADSVVGLVGLGLIFSATSVSIPVAMLFAAHKMHLKSSKATLGAAIIDDIVAVILLSLFFVSVQSGFWGDIALGAHGGHGSSLLSSVGYLVAGLAAILGVGYWVIRPFVEWLKTHHSSYFVTPVAHIIMLTYFGFAELFGGLAGITGAYFAGLFHRLGDHKHDAQKIIAPFVNTILLPLFLGSIGLQLNIRILSLFDWVLVLLLLVLAIVSKLVGCFISTGLSNMLSRSKETWSVLESYIFGAAMVARGEVGLVIATILYGSHIIAQSQYVIAVVVIVLTTIATPIMLAAGFSRLEAGESEQNYELNIGLFKVIGTTHMFNIIVDCLRESDHVNYSVDMSEGRTIVSINGTGTGSSQQVKIILCPDDGIIFEGNRAAVARIIGLVKEAISEELGRLSSH